MEVGQAFATLAIALGLGLLVGTQRERVEAPLAGVRTFALIALFGALTGLMAQRFGAWLPAAGLLAVAIMVAVGNVVFLKQTRADTGITTEIAILLVYAIGAYLAVGHRPVAVALGAGVAILLHAKPALHAFVRRLGETEMRVIMQFALISLVILPVLPDRTMGPFGVLNPREVWWMVVLVVAISLAGWLALKLYGQRVGVLLAGLIGGLVSSTAAAASFSRRAGEPGGSPATLALIILLSSTVVYVRVLGEVFVAAPARFGEIAPPVALLLLSSALVCVAQWRHASRGRIELPPQENPSELRPAIAFGILYALVLLAVAAARQYLGRGGVYAAAGLAGLTDMDAITLGTARLSARGALPAGIVWRSIVVASLSNLAFKAGIATMLGGPELGRRLAARFAFTIAVGAAVLLWWKG